METKVGPLCSQDWKIQQKEVSHHHLTPEMVPGKIRHFLVASFYCSANIYDNTCLALYTRTVPYNMYVPGMTYTGYRTRERYVPYFEYIRVLLICCFGHRCCCCTALILGWRNKSREDERATKWNPKSLLLSLIHI